MAKFEKELWNDFDETLERIQHEILNGSASASLEDSSDFSGENARCSVRIFERYSAMGGNRVSMSVTLFQSGEGPVQLLSLIHIFSVKCPHMGCQLEWNPDEKTWDCPCHGSRFHYDGTLLDGPAENGVDTHDELC